MSAQPPSFPVTEEIYGRLMSFVSRRVATHEEAEDLVQQLLLRLLQSEPPSGERFTAWVFRSAKHAVIDVYRRHQVARTMRVEHAVELIAQAGTGEGSLNTDEEVVAGCLSQLLETLSEVDREALTSVDVEGTSQQRFAEQRGLGYVAAKSRVQRARRRLRQELELRCKLKLDARGMPLECAPRIEPCCK